MTERVAGPPAEGPAHIVQTRPPLTVDPLVPVDPLVEPIEATSPPPPVDPYTLTYNPDSVVTVHGPITGFRRIVLADEQTGLFVRLHIGGEQQWVYLGPEEWLLRHVEPLSITQTLAVTGSMTSSDRQSILVARQLATRDVRVKLRDLAGTPYWQVPTDSVAARLDRDREVAARREAYLKDRLSRVEREEAILRDRLREAKAR